MIHSLQVVRRSAQNARSQAANELRALLVTAPAELREQLHATTLAELVRIASRWRTGATPDTHLLVTKHALHSLARRHQDLTEELRALDAHLGRLVQQAAPPTVGGQGTWPTDLRRAPGGRRRPPRADAHRIRLRPPLRRGPAPGLLRQDQPPPAQPRR